MREELIKIRNELTKEFYRLEKIDKKKSHKLFLVLMDLDSTIIRLGDIE